MYGDSDNTFRWVWQSYDGNHQNSMTIFNIDNIVWPWDSSIIWQEKTLTVIKN